MSLGEFGQHPDAACVSLFQLPVGGGGAVLVLSELESMASRQQREIAQQRRLLEQREARLAVLRGAQVSIYIIASFYSYYYYYIHLVCT